MSPPTSSIVDADHEAPSVFADMASGWSLVSPEGAMFGDDFLPCWPGVQAGVGAFAKKIGVEPEIRAEKWIIRKSQVPR